MKQSDTVVGGNSIQPLWTRSTIQTPMTSVSAVAIRNDPQYTESRIRY